MPDKWRNMTEYVKRPSVAPPTVSLGAQIKNAYFRNARDGITTVVFASLVIWAIGQFAFWGFTEANWQAVLKNLTVLSVGAYPREELWRAWPAVFVVVVAASFALYSYDASFGRILRQASIALLVPQVIPELSWENRIGLLLVNVGFLIVTFIGSTLSEKALRRSAIVLGVAAFPLCFFLLRGVSVAGVEILPIVPINLWGGLLLTLVLSISGIVFSYPIGVLLALGRTSNMLAIKLLCVVYIEFIRGVPLISLLFMAQVMLQLFVPESMSPDRLTRAIITITMFTAAYTAENVRGGLNSIPKGQFEAGKAIGLSNFALYTQVVLPQALATIIPITIVQFIGLVIDTSLVALVGMFDLMGVMRSVISNPDYTIHKLEIIVFVMIVYWLLTHSLATIGGRLEALRDEKSR